MNLNTALQGLNRATSDLVRALDRQTVRRASRRLADLERRTDRLVNMPARQAGALERSVPEPPPVGPTVAATQTSVDRLERWLARSMAGLARAQAHQAEKVEAAAALRQQGAELMRKRHELGARFDRGERGRVELELATVAQQIESLRVTLSNYDQDVRGADAIVQQHQMSVNRAQNQLTHARILAAEEEELDRVF